MIASDDRHPFDLKHYPHVLYGNSLTTLKDELSSRIAYHLSRPQAEAPTTATQLQFAINRVILASGAVVPIRVPERNA
jgi:hypothetical protein